ncbi:MAG: efflux RND transporter periplasmic adaptor subunit, partial [Paracoccaceae bacterium]|nr:efflux RND transporter periplasmic adaptor subunit [Paracoccaceae bacterium]
LRVEVGQQVTLTTEITTIDDRSSILVDFRVPERFVGQIAQGDSVVAQPLAHAGQRLQGVVSAVDNRVDTSSRTLLVQARLANADDTLRAGMAFAIALSLPGEPLPAVDPLSVQWGREGAFVWLVREGRAVRVPIRIMQRAAERVLVQAEFAPGDLIVIEGVQALRPGAEVTVQPAGDAAQAPAIPRN